MAPVYCVALHLLRNLKSVGEHLRMLRKERSHLLCRFKVLLLSIAHTLGVAQKSICGKADKPVVGRTILLGGKVHIICSNALYAQPLR